MAPTRRKPEPLRLMGVAEVATLIGVSRQRVDQLLRAGAGFPPPIAELEAGRIWLAADIEDWAAASGRTKRR